MRALCVDRRMLDECNNACMHCATCAEVLLCCRMEHTPIMLLKPLPGLAARSRGPEL